MPWRYIGEWRYSSTILDFGNRWRWVVNFTPRWLFPRWKSPRYPLDRRQDGSPSRSGCYGEKEHFIPGWNRDAHSLPLYRLSIPGSLDHKWKEKMCQWKAILPLNDAALRNVIPHNLVEFYQRLGGTYYLHLQDRRMSRESKQQA
jgi:hypothetical protein